MCTDNPILVANTLNLPTIMCVQRKAEKKIASEEDIVQANKLAFNDDIGIVTNHVTSMFDVQARFDKGTPEYEELSYRIMAGQLFQQNCIDRAKGIIAKPMPQTWYSIRDTAIRSGDTDDEIIKKQFDQKIVASNKPYFMIYVYPHLRSRYNAYIKNNNYGAIMRFAKYGIDSIESLRLYEPKTQEMIDYLDCFDSFMPVGCNPCLVNRVCWIFEDAFNSYLSKKSAQPEFDYSIMKCNVEYSKKNYDSILALYREYQLRLDAFQKKMRTEKLDEFDRLQQKKVFTDWFRRECELICCNENELCDIILDISYRTEKSKQFAWDICGDTILENLLKNNNRVIHFPELTDGDGEFSYCGENFVMREKVIVG